MGQTMRIIAICLIVALVGLSFDQADAFPAQQESVKSDVHAMAQKAEQETKLVKANQQFAEKLNKEVTEDRHELEAMKGLEQQSVTDAQKILALTQKPAATHEAIQDIEATDRDAAQLSEKIQNMAVDVQTSLGHVAGEMKAAHVPESKLKKMSGELWKMAEEVDKMETRTLGEDQSTSIDDAEGQKRNAWEGEKEARNALMEMSTAATQGYKDLMKSKSILDQDVNGHEDQRLEADIEQQESSLEHTAVGQASPGQLERAELKAESDDAGTPGARRKDFARWGEDQSMALNQIATDAQALAAYQTQSESEIDKIEAPLKDDVQILKYK